MPVLTVRTGLIARLAVLVALILLPGCGSVIDADQARICRAVATALEAEDATISEIALYPVPGEATALRYSYRAQGPQGTAPHWVDLPLHRPDRRGALRPRRRRHRPRSPE